MIGTTISHYKILEKLGEGGMGVVYKAEDTKLDRFVALKFLPERVADSEQDRARFLQEAKAASALNHPNICTIHGIEENDGQLFIVMELVEGQTLRERKSSISSKQALEIGIQLAEGLAAAHEKGIVHRDIKPDNIMIRKDGIAQIMDFGLAKLRGVSKLTKEGSTVGTAGYMSPEQVQGLDADHRSDIFSLGVLLYELLTGEPPFKGVHETALLYEIVNVDVAPMSSIKSDIDPALDAIVLECLEKDPNERTQSVRQVAIDLKRFKRESTRSRVSRVMTAVRPAAQASGMRSGRGGKREVIGWLLAAILGLTVMVLLWAPWRSEPVLPVTRFILTTQEDDALDLVTYSSLAISPDGSMVVYAANRRLVLRNLDNLKGVPIPGTEEGGSPFFSPDGRWIGFFAGGKLKKISVNGGSPIVLADASDNRGGAWSSNGFITFAPIVNAGLVRVPEAGGLVESLTELDTARHERTHRWPHVLPDGNTIIFTVGNQDSPDYYEDAMIEAVNMKTGARKTLIHGASSAHYVNTGHLLFSRTGILYAVPFNPDNLELVNSPAPVVEDVAGDATTGAMHYDVSTNGTFVYVKGNVEGSDRVLVKLDHSGKESVFDISPKPMSEPRVSPDGKRIAVVIGTGKDFDVWIYDIGRGTMSRLTFGGTNRTPTWSPDGKEVAFYSVEKGVVIKPYDGSGDGKVLLPKSGRTYISAWSRNGGCFVLDWATQGGQSDVYVLPDAGDREPFVFLSTPFDEYMSAPSPDAKWLAYVSNESGVYQIYVKPFPSGEGKWQISTRGGFEPRWAPDGKTLYYISNAGMTAVAVSTGSGFSAGQPQVLFKGGPLLPTDSGVTYDITPDGKNFVTTRTVAKQNVQQVILVQNWFGDLRSRVSNSVK